MRMQERLSIFQSQHPKVRPFFEKVGSEAIREGAVIEMKVTSPEGESYLCNIRVTADDMETLKMLSSTGM